MNNKLDYIAIDFETANQYRNSACSVGLVRFIDGKEVDSCYSLIHPAKMYFIPEWTETIHHISYNDVRNKPYFPEIWDTMVMPFVNKTPGVPLVAHNGNMFDMPVIQSCCEYFGMDVPNWNTLILLLLLKRPGRSWNLIGLQNLELILELNILRMMLLKIPGPADRSSNLLQINGESVL